MTRVINPYDPPRATDIVVTDKFRRQVFCYVVGGLCGCGVATVSFAMACRGNIGALSFWLPFAVIYLVSIYRGVAKAIRCEESPCRQTG